MSVPEFNPLDTLHSPTLEAMSGFDVARQGLLYEFFKHRAQLPEDSSYEIELMERIEAASAEFKRVSEILLFDDETEKGVVELAQLWHADEEERRTKLAMISGAKLVSIEQLNRFIGVIGEVFSQPGTARDSIDNLEEVYLLRLNDELELYVDFIEDRKRYRDIGRRVRTVAGKVAVGAAVIAATGFLAKRYIDSKI